MAVQQIEMCVCVSLRACGCLGFPGKLEWTGSGNEWTGALGTPPSLEELMSWIKIIIIIIRTETALLSTILCFPKASLSNWNPSFPTPFSDLIKATKPCCPVLLLTPRVTGFTKTKKNTLRLEGINFNPLKQEVSFTAELINKWCSFCWSWRYQLHSQPPRCSGSSNSSQVVS